ncbi:endonuclease domain-containing protein [Gloeocapsopsis sp. IPPAS B-1203]|uniref:endonuclease domain-containing protein n=1 Tax=Gloeocapsopsis sp. IPPAS B-1203 TaxID=2049454 RepID=UPI0025A19E07|nr:endonuclease domain-containing protein [Gloeocapsopsis sp. IPPAS B-1203]
MNIYDKLLTMKSHRIRGTTPRIVAAARHLRQNLTPTEKILWQALRNRQLKGLRFRCQHAVCSFIVDFYCAECRLVVELDGEIHNQQLDYDNARTEQLQRFGLRVIRFRNQEVMTNLEWVLQQILEASREKI